MKTTESTVLALVLVAGALLACSKKGPECKALADTINPAVKAINENAKDAGTGLSKDEKTNKEHIAHVGKLASLTKKLADDIRKIELTVKELKEFRDEYATMNDDVSAAASATKKALDEGMKLMAELEKMGQGVKAAMEGIQKACGRARKEPAVNCIAVGKRLQAFPKDLSDAKAVKNYADELKDLKAKSDGLKKALKDAAEHLEKDAALLGKVKKFRGDVMAADKKLKGALAKEDPAMKRFNDFCAGD